MKKQSATNTITLERFIKTTKKDLEKKIKQMISDKYILLVLEKNKHIRPILVNLIFKACTKGKETPNMYQKALEGGVVIELAHAASLVHDELINKANKRHEKTSFFEKSDAANAILTGHKMLVIGFNVALKHGEDWAKLYVDSWDEVIDGEIDEVKINKKSFSLINNTLDQKLLDRHTSIIDYKKAAQFSSVCKAGVLEAKKSGDILKIFSEYGTETGVAYQFANDLVDLVNGKMVDSVIASLLNKLNKNKIKLKSNNKILIKTLFAKNKHKIQQYYLDEIKKHIKKVEKISKSDIIPESPYKHLIKDFPRFIINEILEEVNITI